MNPSVPRSPVFVRYSKFAGLNTRKDPHNLLRSELADSVNLWSANDGSLAKRPGSPAFLGTGPTGAGVGGVGLISARFNGLTYLVALQIVAAVPKLYYATAGDLVWTFLGNLSAGVTSISGAQMFDPETGFDTLFICDGVDIPQTWKGPGTGLVPVKTGIQGGTDVITTNPALAGGGNLIAAVNAAAASDTTVLAVTVNATGTAASIVDASGLFVSVAPGGTVTIDGVVVTLGAFAAGDAGKVGSITVTQAHAYLPNNATNAAPITPKYVATLGNNSHLFYSGEKTAKSAVYVSNPFFPQRFESLAMQVGPYAGTYLPAIIGLNDGVDGGAVTGLCSLRGAMIVFKESAIYAMIFTVLLSDVPAWQVVQVSSNGALSPRSIVAFDIDGNQFIAYLSIDGVYATDGMSSRKVTKAVPSFFDSSLNGAAALITDRTSAIGARHANRLLLSFATSLVGYNEGGIWLDFDHVDADGQPLCGQIGEMNIGGMVELRGPHDDGNVAWIDAKQDRVGKFGVGQSDFGEPINVVFSGKPDFFEEEFGVEAPIKRKVIKALYLMVSVPPQITTDTIRFSPVIISDTLKQFGPGNPVKPVTPPAPTGWGGVWGSFDWSGGNTSYVVVKIPMQAGVRGCTLQVRIAELSTVAWVLDGYIVELNDQLVDI